MERNSSPSKEINNQLYSQQKVIVPPPLTGPQLPTPPQWPPTPPPPNTPPPQQISSEATNPLPLPPLPPQLPPRISMLPFQEFNQELATPLDPFGMQQPPPPPPPIASSTIYRPLPFLQPPQQQAAGFFWEFQEFLPQPPPIPSSTAYRHRPLLQPQQQSTLFSPPLPPPVYLPTTTTVPAATFTLTPPMQERTPMTNIASFSLKELDCEAEDEELLTLSLSTNPRSPVPASSQDLRSPLPSTLLQQPCMWLSTPPPSHVYIPINPPTSHQDGAEAGSSRPPQPCRYSVQLIRRGKSETIPAPYPWATTRRATVHTLQYLLSNGMNIIKGDVQCKRCRQKFKIEYDLQPKFMEVASFISEKQGTMHDRAPAVWMNPTLPNCQFCEQNNCVKPILLKKKTINWLFLLLGQMLGCCKLAELKYFCKHTENHRTGAKDRVLYLTYLGMCKQLDPEELFDR